MVQQSIGPDFASVRLINAVELEECQASSSLFNWASSIRGSGAAIPGPDQYADYSWAMWAGDGDLMVEIPHWNTHTHRGRKEGRDHNMSQTHFGDSVETVVQWFPTVVVYKLWKTKQSLYLWALITGFGLNEDTRFLRSSIKDWFVIFSLFNMNHYSRPDWVKVLILQQNII